jgi:hypothetical protein
VLLAAVGLRTLLGKPGSRRTTSRLHGHLLTDLDAWRLARKT